MLLPTENHQADASPDSRVALAVRRAVADGLVGADRPVAGFVDVRGVRDSVAGLHAAFAHVPDVLHTFAAKACSLVPVLRLLADAGMGCEVASPGELRLALDAGFEPARIVLDSPPRPVRRSVRPSPWASRSTRTTSTSSTGSTRCAPRTVLPCSGCGSTPRSAAGPSAR